jgi:spermidine/putrescine transport system permease protein
MMFVPSMGEYSIPIMVGGPDSMMVGNLVQSMFGQMNNWPAGAALVVVMMLTIALAGIVFMVLNKLVKR